MKKQFFFSMLAAAALMASCSSENAVAPEAGGNEYGLIEGQPAFLSIGIAMPSDPATRANDDVFDGAPGEYEVKSGRLILFKGLNELSATYFNQYNITSHITGAGSWQDETGSTHITSTSKKFIQEISSPSLSGSEKLYAYVILNDKDNITMPSLSSTTTFEEFSKEVFTAIGIGSEADGYGSINSNGFVMTSVPVSTAPGHSSDPSSGKVITLTPINKSAVYKTYEEADDAAASVACCYVERAAVKVDFTFNASIDDPADAGSLKIDVAKVEWGLGNVNFGGASGTGYYNTRQVEEAWSPLFNVESTYQYRFVSAAKLMNSVAGHDDRYRTYFGKDVNYVNAKGANPTNLKNAKVVTYPLASSATTYTYENTFDENSQVWKNTTYVAIKVQLNNDQTFYTIDGANNTALDLANLKTTLANHVDAQIASAINDIKNKIQSAITADISGSNTIGATSSVTFDLDHSITVNAKDVLTGKCTYTDNIVLKNVLVDGGAASSTQLTAINALPFPAYANIGARLADPLSGYDADVVNEYTDGVTYYSVRISHFGDAETPWNTEAASYNNYDKIYPSDGQALGVTPSDYGVSRKAAWLGRWGIVRNNWYSITVTNVQGIGDAVPVDYSGAAGVTPDDNPQPKYYIAAHIHILPWVKRTQSVEL